MLPLLVGLVAFGVVFLAWRYWLGSRNGLEGMIVALVAAGVAASLAHAGERALRLQRKRSSAAAHTSAPSVRGRSAGIGCASSARSASPHRPAAYSCRERGRSRV